jgi:hypothetical protein
MKSLPLRRALAAASFLAASAALLFGADSAPAKKPVLLYSRYFNAEGEKRYLPDGTYKAILEKARDAFEVRVSNEPLNRQTLAGVNVVLIANPSDKANGQNPPPHHFSDTDIRELTRFVENGGGFVIMGNQENHNLETEDTNKLLAHFGMQFTNLYTDAKKLVLPATAPVIGGLRWAYYTGNLVLLDSNHRAKPRPLAQNDLTQKPPKGTRDQEGVLMGASEPGKGRVIVVTDSGWLTDDALSEKGIGDVAIKGQDNWEIFRRLVLWAAHQ